MLYITRKENFNAAHRLFRADYDDKKNLEVFGKCSNPNWHGHNYTLWVTVAGDINPETGFVINLKHLSMTIQEKIIDKIDHKNINLEVDFMKGKMASTEMLTLAIWEQLDDDIKRMGARLFSVKLFETENNFAEYFGENENKKF
jgi:6-pyruvoyltetrahydropterin/6-carboxytetrahydropterin synthase